MTRSTKAMLLSTLLWPGSGLFLWRRYGPASLLSGVAGVALYLLFSATLAMAQGIRAQILRGELPLEPAAILQAVQRAATASGHSLDLATLVLVSCWLAGVVLTYRAGRSD